jgi:hypothetical protein
MAHRPRLTDCARWFTVLHAVTERRAHLYSKRSGVVTERLPTFDDGITQPMAHLKPTS